MNSMRVALAVAVIAAIAVVWKMGAPQPASVKAPTPASKPVAPQASQPEPKAAQPSVPVAAASLPAPTPAVDPMQEAQKQCSVVLNLANASERKLALDKMLAATTDLAGLKGMVAAFAEMTKAGRVFEDEWRMFWHTVAHRDPKMAIAVMEGSHDNAKWYGYASAVIVQEWASIDPQAAMKWLDGNTTLKGTELDRATANLIYGYAAKDLKAATEYALKVIPPDDALFGPLAAGLTEKAVQQGGVAGLFSWFSGLPDDSLRGKFFASVSNRLSEVDPEQQRAWLLSQATQPYRNDDTYRNMLGSWAKNDPRAAMNYAVNLPPSPKTKTYVGLAYAAYEWLVLDTEAFTTYFNSIPSPAVRDEIVKAIKLPLTDKNFPNRKREPAMSFLERVKK